MKVASITKNSYANGPGRRNVLHVQGCTLSCPGCFNKNTWSSYGGTEVSLSDVVEELMDGDPDGITISGGEPMEQWRTLEGVIMMCLSQKPTLSVLVFTGWNWSELSGSGRLAAMSKPFRSSNSLVSIVIAGRYVEDSPSGRPLRSSTNQRALFLDSNYSEKDLVDLPVVEVHCGDGEIKVSGFPDKPILNVLSEGVL
mgnify:CR=1 FL=1